MRKRTILLSLASLTFAQAGPLHDAARDCDPDQLRRLLAKNPQVNAVDEHGMTPLHIAIDAQQVACVPPLLQAGADRMARDGRGRTAFRAADEVENRQNRATIRQYLLGGFARSRPEAAETGGPPPWSLEYTVMRGQTGVTKMLLSMGVDPNAMTTRGTTPLADAALKGSLADVRLLLDAGARVDAVSKAGSLPIHDAALGDNPEILRALVTRGADVNARTRDENRTPLHLAAAMGRMKALETLVELGADLAAQDSNGRTALETAERSGLTDVAAFLTRAAASR